MSKKPQTNGPEASAALQRVLNRDLRNLVEDLQEAFASLMKEHPLPPLHVWGDDSASVAEKKRRRHARRISAVDRITAGLERLRQEL